MYDKRSKMLSTVSWIQTLLQISWNAIYFTDYSAKPEWVQLQMGFV